MLIFVMRILCVMYAHTMRGDKSSGITLAEGKANPLFVCPLLKNKTTKKFFSCLLFLTATSDTTVNAE